MNHRLLALLGLREHWLSDPPVKPRKGRPKIAQRFSAGNSGTRKASPVGTTEARNSVVPTGLIGIWSLSPSDESLGYSQMPLRSIGGWWSRMLLLVALLVSLPVFPAGTAFWEMDTYTEFARGRFTGISLSRDGKLSLAPRLEEVFATGQALVWTMVEDGAGNIYLGTGHAGKVFKLDTQMKGREFFDAAEPDVFALAVDRQNNLYVGTSPDGKVYKIAPDGKSQEFFNPQAKYIWSLAVAPDGALFVGTGDRGRIFRVAPEGQGTLFFDTHQTHVMSLALAPFQPESEGIAGPRRKEAGTGLAPDRALVAGTEPNGLLYRISPAGKAFVLYDAPLAEIHSVAVAPDGSVLVSAIAAGGQRRGPGAMGGEVFTVGETSAGPVTITVQATPPPGSEGQKEQEKSKEAREAAERAAREAAAAGAALPVPSADLSAGIRSAIYRVAPDRTVETLWSSRDENVYDVLPGPDGLLLFSTDERGRIYQLTADKQTTLLVQTNEEQTTRLLRRAAYSGAGEPGLLAATSNFGKLFRLGAAPGDRGWYESPVKDTRSISRWGKLAWRGQAPAGARVEFFTRSGNAANPDHTWSDWERGTQAAAQSGRADLFEEQIASPPARYLQWKAVFHAAGGRSATLEEVTVAYLPQNRAPIVHSVTATPTSSAAPAMRLAPGPLPGGAAVSSTEPIVVTVTDTPEPAVKSPFPKVSVSAPASARGGAAPQPTVNIAWQAEDPDGDRMTFTLYIRGEGESEWKLLKDNLREPGFQPEPETLPDGKYQVRVVASDAEANPRESARTAEQQSAPFLIDNTPPEVRLLKAERKGAAAEVRFQVSDAASVLKRAEHSVDNGPWLPVYSEDGIVDSRVETFLLQLDKLAPGEHVVLLRAYDSGNNAGMGKAILK